MSNGESEELEQRLLKLVQENSHGISKDVALAALRASCAGLSKDRFDELVLGLQRRNQTRIETGAYGRSWLREMVAVEPPGCEPELINNETHLEPCVEGFLWRCFASKFLDQSDGHSLIVQNTARGGAADGLWSKPDLTVAVVSRYIYTPNKQLELYSFELKMPEGCTVYAVHEALAHAAFAHYPYLVVYLPLKHQYEHRLPRMMEQAQGHGVGIIVVSNPGDDKTFDMRLVAQRHAPTPRRIDDFIGRCFDNAHQLALQSWIR